MAKAKNTTKSKLYAGRIINVKGDSSDSKGRNIEIEDAPIFQGEEAKQFYDNSPYNYTLHYDWENKVKKPKDAIVSKKDSHFWITKSTFDPTMDRQTYVTIRDILLQNSSDSEKQARKSAEIKQETWRRRNGEVIDRAREDREKQMDEDRNNPLKNEGFWEDFRDGFVDGLKTSLETSGDILENVPGFGGIAKGAKAAAQGVDVVDKLTRGGNLIRTKVKGGWRCEKCHKVVPDWDKHRATLVHGAGLLDWLQDKIKGIPTVFSKNISGFNNTSTATLKQLGDYPIVGLRLFKRPIHSALDTAINLISLGKWNTVKQQYNFDKLYHLGALATVDVDGVKHTCQFEKIQAVKFFPNQLISGTDVQYMDVPLTTHVTLNEMTTKARQQVGDAKYFDYSGLGTKGQPPNNCQWFIKYNLEYGLGVWNDKIKQFVMQDLTELSKDMPDYAKSVMDTVTDLGAWWDRITGGNLHLHAIKVHNSIPTAQQIQHVQSISKSKKKRLSKQYGDYTSYRIIPKTKFNKHSYKTKDVMDGKIKLVFGELKK